MTDAPEAPFHTAGNFRPVATECTTHSLDVEGTIPDDLNGMYVRNGPNPRPSRVAGHWFHGDGMLHGVTLVGGEARSYRRRWVATSTFTNGDRVVGTDGCVDFRAGVANTNVIRHAGRMLALVETSFPQQFTKELATIGPFDFDGRLTTAMTAHPKVCPITGELHFFGYSFRAPYLTYHRADAQGCLVQSSSVDVPGATMIHDFAITASRVVFFDLPVVFDLERALAGTMPFRWDDDYGARIGIMRRDDPAARVEWFEIEPCYVFHVLNAYDNGNTVVIDAMRYPEMWRDTADAFGAPALHRWTIDTSAAHTTESRLDNVPAEFPRIDDRRTGLPHRYGYAVHTPEPHQGSILRYDLTAGTTDVMSLGKDRVPSEAVFVPASPDAAEDDGFLLSYVYDGQRDATDLAIMSATDIDAPPVALVHLPTRVPFGFHGNWFSGEH